GGPAQVGFNGSANFVFVSHRLSFSPSSVYSKMLRDTAKQLAIINDVEARRSWLVPKLSLLLHMAHSSVREHTPAHLLDDLKDPVPFCEPHYDGFAVVSTLEGHGDVTVWGEGRDSFTLRSLLLGLNINLLKAIEITEPSSGNNLYGFEFMDIVTEPGRGAEMRVMPLMKSGKNWLQLSKLVDTLVFCAGLGEAILPEERRSTVCSSLPIGRDYLAAPMSCLGQLTKRCGGDFNAGGAICAAANSSRIMLSQDRFWNFSGDPFKKCKHDGNGSSTCWDSRNILQQVRKTGGSTSVSTTLHRRVPLSGVVVFGQ
ncbi:hypothetical protein K469DRAFT_455738, partial [Zopfia rhizophila CBS 207.26]